ncbi:nucleotidyltransferase domain-containing protein [Candidatus Pacearchaeota archaeon]|nr:nucleotidyltransferase domain-containing protein [Candidatus Pacearchaeota archaeon]
MKKSVNSILGEVLEKIKLSEKESEIIKNSSKEFLKKFRERLLSLKIDAEIFVGGSFAKETMIKKDDYDIDVFIRFSQKYKDEEISKLLGKLLKGTKNMLKIHGSRDYFRIKINPQLCIEVIPVTKIKNPKEARNITDLSYSHVNYIKRKVKSEKVLDEIKLAKAFCYANHYYGAESYINGFSGYALELLIYYYKSFLKFIRAMNKIDDKLIIDIEKLHKNKQFVLMDLNSSKLISPIILIDPTYKQRNALAALSEETFKEFKKTCKEFLQTPKTELFELQKMDLEKIKNNAKKKKHEFILIMAETNKQTGAVAGSKLLKFHKHLNQEISNFFEVQNKGFDYTGKKSAKYFFVVKNKKEILVEGPNFKDKKNVEKFKKKHKHTYIKSKKICAKEKIKFNITEFIKSWEKKNKQRIKEMYIKELKII